MYGITTIDNCYNIGTITGTNDIGMIIGTGNITANNCYYLSTLAATDSYATAKSDADMKIQSFVDLLNSGQVDTPWQLDTGINNGYPILKWQVQD